MKQSTNTPLNRATKSRRVTAVNRSEELLLLKTCLVLKELTEVYYPAELTPAVQEFLQALALWRQGMLQFDEMEVSDGS